MFLAGYGCGCIARLFDAEGVPTKYSGGRWADHTVVLILKNEKYCGDCLFQKSYIASPITHKCVPNRGELPQYLVEDVFPAIIPKEEWKAAQELFKRHTIADRLSEDYPFTNLLKCRYCGKPYAIHQACTYNRAIVKYYRCASRVDHNWVEIPDMVYTAPSRLRIENPSPEMIEYRKQYCKPPKQRPFRCSDIRLAIDRPQKAFVQAWNQLVGKKARYHPALQRTADSADSPLTRYRAKEMIGLLDTVGKLKEFDFPLMLRTLDYVEVSSDEKLSFVFQSGIRVTV